MSNNRQHSNHDPTDHAGTAFDPRHLLTWTIIIGLLIRRIIPLAFLPSAIVRIGGPIITIGAFALFFWAAYVMSTAKTPIPVNQPTESIVDSGPFRMSRNPTYVAILLFQIGVGVWANSLWFLGFAVISVPLLQWGVIVREERYLEEKFGEEYLDYKRRVRRWV